MADIAALALMNPPRIRDLVQGRQGRTQWLREQIRLYRHWTVEARDHWEDLTPEQQDFLKQLAYRILSPPRFFLSLAGLRDLPIVLLGTVVILRSVLAGELDLLGELITGGQTFAQTVLDVVEQQDKDLQQQFATVVAQALKQTDEERAQAKAAFHAWLSN